MIASSLFHFTKFQPTLIQIISSGKLRASYNLEDVSDFYPKEKYAAIPMVCFCDIPLKFISEHPMVYGKYGIGLKKNWGQRNGINPILYRTDSAINKYLQEIINATKTIPASNTGTFSKTVINDNVIRLTNFSKKYQQNKTINYLDREWRYVPKTAEIPFIQSHSKKEISSINSKYFNNSPDYLSFELTDIKHIIVPTKTEVIKLIASIQKLKMTNEEKLHLCQLIIDLKSIKKDF